MKYNYLILILFLFIACTPEAFKLNVTGNKKVINAVILGDFKNVEQINDNSIILKNGGITSLRVLSKTQSEMKFEMEFIEGDNARFGIRTTRVNYNPNKDIIFEINGTDVSLYINGKIFLNKRLANSDKKSKIISIKNLGDELKISIDCDEIIHTRTKLPVTEYLMVECSKNSTLKLSGIVFDFILNEKKINF